MIWCNDCKEFAEAKTVGEFTGNEKDGYREYLYYEVCSRCGSENIDDTRECEICGDDFVTDESSDFCNNCMNELTHDIDNIIEKFMNRYDRCSKKYVLYALQEVIDIIEERN